MSDEAKPNPSVKILLVEDDDNTRAVALRFLKRAGYLVTEARNAREAVSMLKALPDLVITDLFMPEGDGFEMMSEIRRRAPSIPVIVMSGGGEVLGVDYLDIANKLGAVVILRKPFNSIRLLDAVTKAIAAVRPEAA